MAFLDKAPIKKKKKSPMSPLSDKMGLDMSTDMVSGTSRPPIQQEQGLLGASPEATLNPNQNVAGKVRDKLAKRKRGARSGE
jgi:hypothetical protein